MAVTINDEYPLSSANLPNILYNAYPIPDPSPNAIPRKDGLAIPPAPGDGVVPIPLAIPLTRAQPIIANSRARSLVFVSFSLKNIADRSVTNIGDVYIRIAATAAELSSTFRK